ncbi:hypothetical protein BDV09DRAFT_52996 [Aspergillus tetrazonus]
MITEILLIILYWYILIFGPFDSGLFVYKDSAYDIAFVAVVWLSSVTKPERRDDVTAQSLHKLWRQPLEHNHPDSSVRSYDTISTPTRPCPASRSFIYGNRDYSPWLRSTIRSD